MGISALQKKLHLCQRAGFGIRPEEMSVLEKKSLKDCIADFFDKKREKSTSVTIVEENIAEKYTRENPLMFLDDKSRQEAHREINRQNTEKIKDLSLQWMSQMVNAEDQLREKTALFWHGHFACRMQNVFYQQQLLQVIRENALGDFKTLLTEVSKSAAMLNFLNNQQNKKAHPNENFAREVMELFTLGRGNYTEMDIKEAARAFTGWSYKKDGSFQLNEKAHDEGHKTVLGKSGNLDGDDILDILVKKKETAHFLSTKLYKFFVNDTPDEKHIQWMADRFYKSGYDINKLLKDVFTQDWFYDKQNIGAVIKSPIELTVGIQRNLPMRIKNENVLLKLSNALGQLPFYPPNVAGWPGGSSWIDSSSLMLRLKIPQLIEDDSAIHIQTKQDDDIQMGKMQQTMAKASSKNKKNKAKDPNSVQATIDWNAFMAPFADVKRPELFDAICNVVILGNPFGLSSDAVIHKVDSSSREAYIRTVTIALMSTPEYQLG